MLLGEDRTVHRERDEDDEKPHYNLRRVVTRMRKRKKIGKETTLHIYLKKIDRDVCVCVGK